MWTTRSPGVRRSRMSRGTTRRIAFGRRTRTVPKSSRSVTKARPSGPPSKPPFRLRSTIAIAPGGGASGAWTTAVGMAGLVEELGESRRLVAGEDDPGAVRLPAIDGLGDRRRARRRELRLAPAEQVAGAQAAGRERLLVRQLRLPGELQRPPGDEPALPVARPEIRRRPVLRQVAGARSAPSGARRPGARGTRRPRRSRRARRGRGGSWRRGGRSRSTARGGRPRPRRRRRR